MIKAALMIILIAGSLILIMGQIPGLYDGLADLIDNTFDTDLASVINNVYSTIPDDIMDLLTIGFSVLAITIILSYVVGGKK